MLHRPVESAVESGQSTCRQTGQFYLLPIFLKLYFLTRIGPEMKFDIPKTQPTVRQIPPLKNVRTLLTSTMKTIFCLILAWLTATTNLAVAKTPGEVAVGGTLREATMQGLSGASRNLSEFRGKPLIINVWASWCGPCQQEMGSLERLARSKVGKQFTVIGISTDDYPEAAHAFLRRNKTSFSHFIDQHLLLENMLGADHLPLTVLVDAQGRVLSKYVGAKEWDSPSVLALIGKTFHLKL